MVKQRLRCRGDCKPTFDALQRSQRRMGIGIGGTDMKFELLLSHWLRVTNIIYAALSSGVLAAVLAFPEFRRILFQSWLVVTDVFQLFLIILLFILLSKIAQLNRIRNGWRNEKRKEKNL